MNQNTFKVGDWVIHQYGFIDKIEHIRDGGYMLSFYEGDSIMPCLFSGSELELWQPKQGEWCWFIDGDKFALVKYLRIGEDGQHEGQCSQYKDIVYSKRCEPFIGELPSFLK